MPIDQVRLCGGKVESVLSGLRRMPSQSEDAAKTLAHCWGCLDTHRAHTASTRSVEVALRCTVGGIESSHKCICHVRLQRSGAW
jgi:hypothetical protein